MKLKKYAGLLKLHEKKVCAFFCGYILPQENA